MIPGKLVAAKEGNEASKVVLRWEHKAGDTYKDGAPADHGFVSVGANLWQDASGRAGTLLQAFGTTPAICIPYH
jgi:hypothetical protein